MSNNRIPLIHAERYILGGDAIVIFYNTNTGNQYRYRITEKREGVWTVYSFTERKYICSIGIDLKPVLTVPIKSMPFGDPEKVFVYVWHHIRNLTLVDTIHILHTGRCSVCKRTLTDAESLITGIGPICSQRLKRKNR